MVTSSARVSSGKKRLTVSSSESFPSSCSSRMALAVNCLEIEPTGYFIVGVAFSTGSSRALPYAAVSTTWPLMTTPTEALGTPVCSSTWLAAASILARSSGVICAAAARKRKQQDRAGGREEQTAGRIGGEPQNEIQGLGVIQPAPAD